MMHKHDVLEGNMSTRSQGQDPICKPMPSEGVPPRQDGTVIVIISIIVIIVIIDGPRVCVCACVGGGAGRMGPGPIRELGRKETPSGPRCTISKRSFPFPYKPTPEVQPRGCRTSSRGAPLCCTKPAGAGKTQHPREANYSRTPPPGTPPIVR